MLGDRTPQQVRLASLRNEHLAEVPRSTELAPRNFSPVSKALT
jgi:hypothetical protein